jgi:hypothetical protein
MAVPSPFTDSILKGPPERPAFSYWSIPTLSWNCSEKALPPDRTPDHYPESSVLLHPPFSVKKDAQDPYLLRLFSHEGL